MALLKMIFAHSDGRKKIKIETATSRGPEGD
jgi:hypothetical protein